MRNSKGFTLVEMAVVLVIIGVIIGAVVKGQDLIVNAQAKQVTSAVSSWRNLTYAFLDRNGRYPGDELKNGIIGDQTGEKAATTSATFELATTMKYYPGNPVVVGGENYYVYFGNVSGFAAGTATRNAMFICGAANCATALSQSQAEILKSIDTAYDSAADAGAGQIRALITAPTITLTDTAVTNTSPAVSEGVLTTTGVVANIVNAATSNVTGAVTPWTSTYYGAVWLFDKPF